MRPAFAQINPTVGDLRGNAALMLAAAKDAAAEHADLILFPELAICGYPPKDLLLAEGFVARCELACASLAADVAKIDPHLTVLVGSPRLNSSGGIANSLLAFRESRLIASYDKRLLPTYDVFDENRYFTPGSTPVVIDVPDRNNQTTRVGLAICEDLWKGQDAGFAARYLNDPDPVPALIAAGARVIAVASASPFVLGKGRRHHDLLRNHAVSHRAFVLSVNQVGGNDDLIFDGHAAAYDPTGRLIATLPGFTPALTVFDLAPRDPAAPDLAPREPDDLQLFQALVLGVRDYCRKTGFIKSLIGLSGGIDSAVTAAIAAIALGPANVHGIAMPSVYSSDHSLADAYDLAKRLSLPISTIPISPAVEGLRGSIDATFKELRLNTLGQALPDLTEENLQSRVRGTLLMALSNRTGAIVLTTGNKSELAVGYCTLYGDMNGGLAVLSDVSKQWVYRLARFMNANFAQLGFTTAPIPQRSIDKAPSAELRPNQTDQDSLPPYDILDAIIDRYVERKQSPDTITRDGGFEGSVVRRVCRMIDLAEYKRKQAAVGLKVTSVAFGTGRRVPIAQKLDG